MKSFLKEVAITYAIIGCFLFVFNMGRNYDRNRIYSGSSEGNEWAGTTGGIVVSNIFISNCTFYPAINQ